MSGEALPSVAHTGSRCLNGQRSDEVLYTGGVVSELDGQYELRGSHGKMAAPTGFERLLNASTLKEWWSGAQELVGTGFSRLHWDIVRFCAAHELSPEQMKCRRDGLAHVENVVHELWPTAEVRVFGSLVTGLTLPWSDIDVTILTPDHRTGILQRGSKTSWLSPLRSNMIRHRQCQSVKAIPFAKVPLLKIVMNSGVACDISYNEESGLRSVSIVRHFMKQYEHLRPLCLVVKYFLGQQNLNDLHIGGLSSYCIVIMLVSHFQKSVPIAELAGNDLGVLLLSFFAHFSTIHNYLVDVVSVGVESQDTSKQAKGWINTRYPELLAVEDPLDPTSNLCKGSHRFEEVRTKFTEAHRKLLVHWHYENVLTQLILPVGNPNQKPRPLQVVKPQNSNQIPHQRRKRLRVAKSEEEILRPEGSNFCRSLPRQGSGCGGCVSDVGTKRKAERITKHVVEETYEPRLPRDHTKHSWTGLKQEGPPSVQPRSLVSHPTPSVTARLSVVRPRGTIQGGNAEQVLVHPRESKASETGGLNQDARTLGDFWETHVSGKARKSSLPTFAVNNVPPIPRVFAEQVQDVLRNHPRESKGNEACGLSQDARTLREFWEIHVSGKPKKISSPTFATSNVPTRGTIRGVNAEQVQAVLPKHHRESNSIEAVGLNQDARTLGEFWETHVSGKPKKSSLSNFATRNEKNLYCLEDLRYEQREQINVSERREQISAREPISDRKQREQIMYCEQINARAQSSDCKQREQIMDCEQREQIMDCEQREQIMDFEQREQISDCEEREQISNCEQRQQWTDCELPDEQSGLSCRARNGSLLAKFWEKNLSQTSNGGKNDSLKPLVSLCSHICTQQEEMVHPGRRQSSEGDITLVTKSSSTTTGAQVAEATKTIYPAKSRQCSVALKSREKKMLGIEAANLAQEGSLLKPVETRVGVEFPSRPAEKMGQARSVDCERFAVKTLADCGGEELPDLRGLEVEDEHCQVLQGTYLNHSPQSKDAFYEIENGCISSPATAFEGSLLHNGEYRHAKSERTCKPHQGTNIFDSRTDEILLVGFWEEYLTPEKRCLAKRASANNGKSQQALQTTQLDGQNSDLLKRSQDERMLVAFWETYLTPSLRGKKVRDASQAEDKPVQTTNPRQPQPHKIGSERSEEKLLTDFWETHLAAGLKPRKIVCSI